MQPEGDSNNDFNKGLIQGIKRSCPDIRCKDSPSNCSKAAGHDGVNLREGEVGEVGLDDEGGGGLAEEYVGGRVERLAGRRTLATPQSSQWSTLIGDSVKNKLRTEGPARCGSQGFELN